MFSSIAGNGGNSYGQKSAGGGGFAVKEGLPTSSDSEETKLARLQNWLQVAMTKEPVGKPTDATNFAVPGICWPCTDYTGGITIGGYNGGIGASYSGGGGAKTSSGGNAGTPGRGAVIIFYGNYIRNTETKDIEALPVV